MNALLPRYTVHAVRRPPRLDAGFDAADWSRAEEGAVAAFRRESAPHRPEVRFRLLHDRAHLYVRFLVCDRHVRSVCTRYQEMVCRDSCVECFLKPRPDRGYFNFEVNAGGVLLLYYIEDHARLPMGGFAKMTKVPVAWGRRVKIWHSLPRVVEPERSGPLTWGVAYAVPRALFERFTGPLGPLQGQVWRGNVYKCGDDTSQSHWASWAPLPRLEFHLPGSFGEIAFA
jgi:hypothetical protein